MPDDHNSPNGPGWGWAAYILEDLEQTNLRRQIDLSRSIMDPIHATSSEHNPSPSCSARPIRGRRRFRSIEFDGSFSGSILTEAGRSNYVAVFGTGEVAKTRRKRPTACSTATAARQRRRHHRRAQQHVLHRRTRHASGVDHLGRSDLRQRRAEEPADRARRAAGTAKAPRSIVLGHASNEPGHTPNGPSGHVDDFASFHTTGVLFLRGDGSVRIIRRHDQPGGLSGDGDAGRRRTSDG